MVATFSAVLAAVCLAGLLLCAGAVAGLVAVASNPQTDSLSTLLQEGHTPDRFLRQLVPSLPVLNNPFQAMMAIGAAATGLLWLRWLLKGIVTSRATQFAADRVQRLRQHLHRQSLRLDAGDLSGEQTETTRRLFRESASLVESSAAQWIDLTMTGGADLTALVVSACVVHFHAGLECLLPVTASWFLLLLEKKRLNAAADLLAEQIDRTLNHLSEGVEKARIVSGYGMEAFEQQHFAEKLELFGERRRAVAQQIQRGTWVTRCIQVFAVGVPVWILLRHLLSSDQLEAPGAAIIALASALLYRKLSAMEQAHDLELAGSVAAEEIDEYVRAVPAVSQMVKAKFLEPLTRSLQFDQVCMDLPEYPGLLNQLDLKIPAGQRVALISLTREESLGLASLVPRLNDPISGRILIDGNDIARATLESLRAEAMIVSGSNNLFNTTVLDNVICGQSDMTRQQAMDAGKVAHTEHFTRQLPRGYETQIGEFGVQLNVGQAFRLALTRAIARNPALLFVEEPQEVLDSETKTLLDDTYDRICQNRTVIFIPSRLSTVKKSDRVIVLNEGCVAADGKHEDLVRSSELYRHWEYIRFNEFQSHS